MASSPALDLGVGMRVDWRDVSVTIKGKQILAPCSGSLEPGRMVALMGPSGSGKTTLLSALRQDIKHGGEVRFDGARFTPALRQVIGFVEQDDVVLPALTVRQSLSFLAELRFGIRTPAALKAVEEVIAALRLGRVADSVIGQAGAPSRISGGERKRLCIARELLAEPRLLLLDEPTSGLDSTMADSVVASMRRLCDAGGVSMVAAIHQPSAHIFTRFDDLYLLREGRVVYMGPIAEAEPFFTSFGLHRHPSQSTAEYLMDLLVLDGKSSSTSDDAALGKVPDEDALLLSFSGMTSQTREAIEEQMRKRAGAMPELGSPVPTKNLRQRYTAPYMRQLILLSRRHKILLLKDIYTLLGWIQNIGLILISAMLWMRLDFSEANIFPRFARCVWTVGTWMFFPLFGSTMLFQSVRSVLTKELKLGCYSLEVFYIARTILLLPFEFVYPTVWTTGVYWLTNANPDITAYLQVMLLVYITYVLFQGVGLAISAAGMPPARSGTMSILIITYYFAWNNFFMDLRLVPSWISWVRHLNTFSYNLELMMNMIFSDSVEFSCGKSSVDCVASASGVSGDSLRSTEGEGCHHGEPMAGWTSPTNGQLPGSRTAHPGSACCKMHRACGVFSRARRGKLGAEA
eukprot:TRINITY_DN10961_c0_g1_i1.p1 TRINITY_DN10961_c0_g1~~TRINITY_DN10961_c0_g1_i1.p1  ORF type:complete len:631 (-),score=87.62 TRINITY_DN10961_c0_g1_i1:337-2229(-)